MPRLINVVCDRVLMAGFAVDTPRYYRAMDVVVLPSYREGFPVVPLV